MENQNPVEQMSFDEEESLLARAKADLDARKIAAAKQKMSVLDVEAETFLRKGDIEGAKKVCLEIDKTINLSIDPASLIGR